MKKLTITLTLWNDEDGDETEHVFPAVYAVCDACAGTGTQDHAALRNGLTREDFIEDPDFLEQYLAGAYDVACSACNGRRVQLQLNTEDLTPAQQEIVTRYERQEYLSAREDAADRHTRRMESGCCD